MFFSSPNTLARNLENTVLLGSVHEKVADPLGVSPLVVVPGDELDKVLVQLDAGAGVKDRGGLVANEVG